MFNLPLIRVHTELIKTKVDTRVDEFCLLHFSGINLRVKQQLKNGILALSFFHSTQKSIKFHKEISGVVGTTS
jgi:hypothetical protein